MMRLRRLFLTLCLALVPGASFAQAYGQGLYDGSQYGTGVIQIGSIILPNTGTTWASIIAIVLAAIGVGILMYWRTTRRERNNVGIG